MSYSNFAKIFAFVLGTAAVIVLISYTVLTQTKSGATPPPVSGTAALSGATATPAATPSVNNVAPAPGAGNVSAALGSDMLNNYFLQQGLFTPHISNCGVGEAFVEIVSRSGKGFCIEKNERATSTWVYAKKTCADAGKRLLEPWEWQYACGNTSSLGLSKMTDNYEWASNFSLPIMGGEAGLGVAIFGNGGCDNAKWSLLSPIIDPMYGPLHNIYSYHFRCAR